MERVNRIDHVGAAEVFRAGAATEEAAPAARSNVATPSV